MKPKKLARDIQTGRWQCPSFKSVQGEPTTSNWCEALYREQAPGLVLYGRALGLSHGEAEDVIHEVFQQLLRLEQPPAEPRRYLLRAYRNRALNHRRSLWRRVAREFESRGWFEREAETPPHELAAMRCLAGLPPEQREVIVLKLWHRHTFEEIGELLGLSPNTAAGRYRYGLQKLRACLRETNPDESHEPAESLGADALVLDPAPAVGRA